MCIRTRRQGSPTSDGNRNTKIISSWLFSSRSPKTTTAQWQWTVQPHMVGTERGVRERSGGERNAPTIAHSNSELRRMKDSSLKRMIRSATSLVAACYYLELAKNRHRRHWQVRRQRNQTAQVN